jgi:hypothetical protein
MNIDQVKFRERFQSKTIYLRNNDSGRCREVSNCCGKTARSWVVGDYGRAHLFQFCEYTEISKHDYDEWDWARTHQRTIGQLVQCSKDPAVVRAVAKLVGYEEKETR